MSVDHQNIVRIPLTEIHDIKGYSFMSDTSNLPFTVQPFRTDLNDPKMQEIMASVKRNGVLQPCLVRPDQDGGYELVAGYRRYRASELANSTDIPAIVQTMTDEEAAIALVDSNIHRDNILPSERAWAYRLKLEAIKSQGRRRDLSLSQKLAVRSDDEIAKEMGMSGDTLQRFVRLTYLNQDLMGMVDNKQLGTTAAYEISFLSLPEQTLLLDAMEAEQTTPSLAQAKTIKKLSKDGQLTFDSLQGILSEEKKPPENKVTLSGAVLSKYFPRSYTPKQIEDTILRLLDNWLKRRQRDRPSR